MAQGITPCLRPAPVWAKGRGGRSSLGGACFDWRCFQSGQTDIQKESLDFWPFVTWDASFQFKSWLNFYVMNFTVTTKFQGSFFLFEFRHFFLFRKMEGDCHALFVYQVPRASAERQGEVSGCWIQMNIGFVFFWQSDNFFIQCSSMFIMVGSLF